MSEKIDEGKAREVERNAVQLVQKIREMFAPILDIQTTSLYQRKYVDEEDVEGKTRDELIDAWDRALALSYSEADMRRMLEDRLKTIKDETVQTMFELADERIEKERRERRARMRHLIEALKDHRKTSSLKNHDPVQAGYTRAVTMVIEVLELEEADRLEELYDWFNTHTSAMSSGPDAPPKPLPFPQPEATVKIVEKEPVEVSVRELIEKGVTVEEMIQQDVDLKGLLSLIAIIDDWGIGTDVKERCPNELYDEWKEIATYAK